MIDRIELSLDDGTKYVIEPSDSHICGFVYWIDYGNTHSEPHPVNLFESLLINELIKAWND